MTEMLKTPYFIIREDLLEENISGFKKALDLVWKNSSIAYSVKTNSLPWLLKWMNKSGVYAEVVSDEEYELALLSGYNADRIVFNGPIKSDEYLRRAFGKGSIINIDSEHELEYIVREKPAVSGMIGIRVNVAPSIFSENDVGYQEDGFRFGFSFENGELKRAIDTVVAVYGDIAIGLHLHVNSITRSLDVYKAIASYAARVIMECEIQPAYIDIGGGFFGGVPGKTTPEEYILGIKNELARVVDVAKTRLIIEHGSAAVGSTIELHTMVKDVKDTAHGRIITTDGSRIHIDPLWQKRGYLYKTNSARATHPRQVICGYTCMDHDRIMVIEDQPELMPGDQIVYQRVGNYTVTFGGPFIKPFPPVYAQNGNELKLVRRRMTMEEYYRMETV